MLQYWSDTDHSAVNAMSVESAIQRIIEGDSLSIKMAGGGGYAGYFDKE